MAAEKRSEKTRYPGIYRAHKRGCDWKAGGPCKCPKSWQASVYSAREKKSIRKHFDSLGAARTWREDASGAVRQGRMRAPTATTLDETAAAFVAGMRDSSIRDKKGKRYKPSTVRSYDRALRLRVLPELGHRRLSVIDRSEVQAFVERLQGAGLSASTIRNTLDPLRVIFRRAIHAKQMVIDPTHGLLLPAGAEPRDRIASRAEAASLIEALPTPERALWATALYAGLRRGELRALRWCHVDFESGVIRVERGWDDEEGEIEAKSTAGRRRIPLAGELRTIVRAHKLASGRGDDDLVFGRTAELPFVPSTVRARALKAWAAAELQPLTPHEARHCCASYLIAAGLNAKQLSVYIGHQNIQTTYDRYGHLMPDGEQEATEKLDTFFAPKERPAG